jgi:hypothetical protein
MRKFLLTAIECKEILRLEFEGAGDVQNVERTTPQSRRVSPAEVSGALKGRTPQNIGLNVTAVRKILIEGREGIGHCFGSDIPPKSSQTNTIDDLDAAMMCHSQWAPGSRPPSAHSRRFGLMNV